MTKQLLFILFALAGFASASAQNFDTVRIRPLKLTDNLYMLQGSGGNIAVQFGKDGVLMIDNQFAPLSEKIKASIASFASSSDVKYIVNTHVHGDHTGGNDNFKKGGATIIAHDQVLERMKVDQEIKALNRKIPAREKDAWPVITFSNKIDLHLNDDDIEAIHFDKGHTDGDVVIHFKKANVYHTGDLFVRYGYPFIDISAGGGITGFINNLDKILAILDDNSKVIPGHGELATKADVKIFRDKIKDITDQVAAALKKGKKVEDIAALGITDKYEKEWGGGYLKGKDFTLLIAEDLKGSKK